MSIYRIPQNPHHLYRIHDIQPFFAKLNQFHLSKVYCGFLFFILSFYTLPVYSAAELPPPPPVVSSNATPSAQDMLVNISTQLPNLMRMVTAFAFVMGMYFVFIGLLKLKQYGESRTMMSQERELKGPVIFLAVGALLIYLPSTVRVGLSSFWVNPNPYAYLQQQNQWAELITVCLLIIQFIGTIAFIRGLVLLTHLGGHSGQPGTFNKAMSHIVGGIFCINIYQFVQVIMVTLGIQT